MSMPQCVAWALSTAATPVALLISVIYWGVLYASDTEDAGYFNVFGHALNSVIVTIDIVITARDKWSLK